MQRVLQRTPPTNALQAPHGARGRVDSKIVVFDVWAIGGRLLPTKSKGYKTRMASFFSASLTVFFARVLRLKRVAHGHAG